jgi:hypothetical protein
MNIVMGFSPWVTLSTILSCAYDLCAVNVLITEKLCVNDKPPRCTSITTIASIIKKTITFIVRAESRIQFIITKPFTSALFKLEDSLVEKKAHEY